MSIATTITSASTAAVTKTLPPEDIWFGSTPKHLYRGYLNQHNFHAAKPKKPPVKFISPHRLGLGAIGLNYPPQEPHYEDDPYEDPHYDYPVDEVYPFDIIKTKLREPSYMSSTPVYNTKANPNSLFGEVDFDSYESTTAEPKPHEIKAIPRKATTKTLPVPVPVYAPKPEPIPTVYTPKPIPISTVHTLKPTTIPTVHTSELPPIPTTYTAKPTPVPTVYTPKPEPKPPVYIPSTYSTTTVKPYAYATPTTPSYSRKPVKKLTKKPLYYPKKTSKKPSFKNFKNDFYHHHHTTVKPVFHSIDYDFKKITENPVHEVPGEFIDLHLKAQEKPVEELNFGYFEIPPEHPVVPHEHPPVKDIHPVVPHELPAHQPLPYKIDSNLNPHYHSYKPIVKPFLDPGLRKPYQGLKPHFTKTTVKPHAYATPTKNPFLKAIKHPVVHHEHPTVKDIHPVIPHELPPHHSVVPPPHHPVTTVKPYHTTFEPFHIDIPVKKPYDPLARPYGYVTSNPYHVTTYVDGFVDPYNEPDPYGINSGYHFPTSTIRPLAYAVKTHVKPPVYHSTTVKPHIYHSTTVKPHKHFETSAPPAAYYPTPSPHDFYHKSNAHIDPYVPKHHHYDHQFKYNTHHHLKYPDTGVHLPPIGPYGGSDLFSNPLELVGLNDPWLPQGGDIVKLKPTSHPSYVPYEEFDLPKYQNHGHYHVPKVS